MVLSGMPSGNALLPPLPILGNPLAVLGEINRNLDLLIVGDTSLKRVRTLKDRREITLVSFIEWDLQFAIDDKVGEVRAQPQLGDHLQHLQRIEQIV